MARAGGMVPLIVCLLWAGLAGCGRTDTPAPPPAAPPPGDTVITIVADVWYPYNGEPGSDTPGYLIELAQAVFAPAGYTVDYRTMPWSRAIERTRAGEFAAIVGAFTTDAPDFIFPALPLGIAHTVFYVRADNPWRFQTLDSLARMKLGATQDYSYGELLDGYIRAHAGDAERLELLRGDDVTERNLRKLALGRVDAVVDVREVLEYNAVCAGLAGRFAEAGTVSRDNVYIAFSPARAASAAEARLLAEGVARLRRSGELQRLLDRYGLRDWQ